MEIINLLITDNNLSNRKTAHLLLNNQHNMNAINRSLYEELKKILEMVKARNDIGVLILSSELTNAFSSGVDVKYIQTLTNEEASELFIDFSILLDQLAQFPIPTIAIVNGYAFGAGADLALSCDLRIATASTVFRFPGPQFGLILGTQRLINEIGASRARVLTLLNKKVDAQTAKYYGLVHEVCEDREDAHDMAFNWIETLLHVPLNTVQTLKELCSEQLDVSHDVTRGSVLNGDFRKRFYDYIKK